MTKTRAGGKRSATRPRRLEGGGRLAPIPLFALLLRSVRVGFQNDLRHAVRLFVEADRFGQVALQMNVERATLFFGQQDRGHQDRRTLVVGENSEVHFAGMELDRYHFERFARFVGNREKILVLSGSRFGRLGRRSSCEQTAQEGEKEFGFHGN